MSLIVCSNNRTDNEEIGEKSSIFEPWSFRNQLTSNVEIPANGQVALQSVKLNMDGSIILGDDTKVFYMYFGPQLFDPNVYGVGDASTFRITGIENSTQLPMRVALFEGKANRLEKMNVNDLAVEIERSVKEQLTNPNLKDRFTCVVEHNADGSLKGFKWTFNEAITGAGATQFAPTSTIPPAFNHLAVRQRGVLDAMKSTQRDYQITNGASGAAPPWTYAGGVFSTLIGGAPAVRTPSRCMIANVSPLNLKGGLCKFDIINANPAIGGRFMVGLTRASRGRTKLQNGRIRPHGFRFGNGAITRPWMAAYMDFFAFFNIGGAGQGAAAAAGHLRLGHTVVNKDDLGGKSGSVAGNSNRPKQQDFAYGDGTNGSVDTGCHNAVVVSAGFDPVYGYDLTTNPLGIHFIRFQVSGNIVAISMEDNAGQVYDLVTYDAARNMERNLKPITQTCENLLPSIVLNNSGIGAAGNIAVQITQWDGTNQSCPNYDFLSDDPVKNGLVDRVYTGSNKLWTQVSRVDRVKAVDYSLANLGQVNQLHAYGNFDAAGNKEFTNLFHVWSTMPNQQFGGPDCMLTAGANTSRFLGLPLTPTFGDWTLTGTFNRERSSFAQPSLLPTRSVFVRLENFGNESVNAFQGLKSKIIAHLPRFDGIHALGPLYLEPHNLVYVDLKNPSPMKINSFDLSLCYSDETYATSLVGTTIIVLHIREKPS
jgi:hypothetical protein